MFKLALILILITLTFAQNNIQNLTSEPATATERVSNLAPMIEKEITQEVINRSKKSVAQLYKLLKYITQNKRLLEDLYPIYLSKVNETINLKESDEKQGSKSLNLLNSQKVFYGQSNAWKQYEAGLLVDISIKQFELQKTPYVNIFLTGNSSMWELTATGIYYLTNQGFSIYVDCHTGRQFATVENAKLYGWTLRYQVISLD